MINLQNLSVDMKLHHFQYRQQSKTIKPSTKISLIMFITLATTVISIQLSFKIRSFSMWEGEGWFMGFR